ncbi:MAG: copper homeostasis periplasmic binding protein CopC [Acetobacteraceae bacterium]|nr:copper homeostasis periplasmic binding protein CopC [Acetobacteraceae bacterium]
MRTLSITLLGAVSAVLMTVPAIAHPKLIASSPVAGRTASAPTAITLKFSEKLLAAFSGLSITPLSGGGGKAATVLKTSVSPDGHTLVSRLATPLPSGSYLVSWHVVSSDTHRVAGSLRFIAR